MGYMVRVVDPPHDSPWDLAPRDFTTEEAAFAYAFGIVSVCRSLPGPQPVFQIDGTKYSNISAEEIWLICRLYSPPFKEASDDAHRT
jgi:hypothetical protein